MQQFFRIEYQVNNDIGGSSIIVEPSCHCRKLLHYYIEFRHTHRSKSLNDLKIKMAITDNSQTIQKELSMSTTDKERPDDLFKSMRCLRDANCCELSE